MNKDKLQKLKKVIRAANPKLIVMEVKISEEEFAQIANGTNSFDYTKYLVYPDITIADVLIAIKKTPDVTARVSDRGKILVLDNCLYGQKIAKKGKGQIACDWNLLHDIDWHAKNKPETIKFLEDLLIT